MKEATGELNMTLVTVVAIAAIGVLFYTLIWPMIRVSLVNNTCEATCGEGNYTPATRRDLETFECVCRP